MKNRLFYGILMLLNFSLMSSSCSSDDDDGSPNDNSAEIQQVITTAQSALGE
ncbi:hypothetical protein N7U66_13820 [Lacinutrix neustonica]|uniref:Secreted protein n=1 Tax=Lacinutrix neustonica TaxID=2980107 RepID=A0A9E8SCE8_9FLAO|nr:hypothetical protein [Lacinutrix neustonica]WAC01203.1 hypothetical protein N7U66_13820 [Lacinutrix neustonica]